MQEAKKAIEYLLLKSEVSNYRISKDTGIGQNVLGRYSNGESEIENMTLGNAIKLYNYFKEATNMGKIIAELEALKGNEVTLLEMDNELQPISDSDSIFEYGQDYWNDWKDGNKASFVYKVEGLDINVQFEIVEDNGISEDTKVKVVDWEEI